MSQNKKGKGCIALIGANSFMGRRLLPELTLLGPFKRLVVLDQKRPDNLPADAVFYKVDLTQPTADSILVDIFRSEGVTDVLHLAFHSRPATNASDGHELEVIGTFNMLNASAAAGVERVVLRSTTLVYGAQPLNPNYLTEDTPLQARRSYRYLADRVEVERLVQKFRSRHPKTVVTVLRFAPIVGPTISNHNTDYLAMPLAMTILGYDPLMQLLHETDALQAIKLALLNYYNGALNIVPVDVLPLSTLLYLAGKVNAPVPGPLAWPLVSVAWLAGVSPVPPEHIAYLKYLCCGDASKATREIGFKPAYGCRETIESFTEVRRLRRLNLLGIGSR